MAEKKGAALFSIVLGVLGVILILIWDIITKKAVNDITGPKSIAALIICLVLIVFGVIKFKKQKKKK